MAVSAAAVDESTFIWNPNLIALSSAIALAGAWRAWTGARPRWWLLAALGTAVTMQCHVLGVALLPVVGAPLVADARRRGPRGRGARWAASLAIVALAYVPLGDQRADDRLRRGARGARLPGRRSARRRRGRCRSASASSACGWSSGR